VAGATLGAAGAAEVAGALAAALLKPAASVLISPDTSPPSSIRMVP
jgi:hypothetical protein